MKRKLMGFVLCILLMTSGSSCGNVKDKGTLDKTEGVGVQKEQEKNNSKPDCKVKYNEDAFDAIDKTAKQIKEKYGELKIIGNYNGGTFFESENSYSFGFVLGMEEERMRKVENSNKCVTVIIPAKDLFPSMGDTIGQQEINDSFGVECEFNTDEGDAIFFVFDGYGVSIDCKEDGIVRPNDFVMILNHAFDGVPREEGKQEV